MEETMAGMTLLLNASYEPLSVITWQRAMTLFFLEKVEVVAEYDDKHIHSSTSIFQMPSVVRLVKYVRRRYMGVKFSRQNIYARDGYTCQYCGDKPPLHDLSFDHVAPRSQGGRTCWENIVACCVDCNRTKGGRTPEEAGMPLLKRPVKPRSMAHLSLRVEKQKPPSDWLTYLP
jgi:5-methylcytosine-specific restriction endonuclease McrA